MDLNQIRAVTDALRTEVRKAVVGQDEVIDFMLTSLLVGGHILLEGVPGTAKTLLTQAFAAGLSLQFGRIQFTPDLMPGDVLGTNLFNFQTNAFVLTKGPIFTQLLLADEINRTPPKTQAALLQAMNERAVTIDGRDYALGEEFMVVATQNPIEQQGTYPLPEAQLDRFLFKITDRLSRPRRGARGRPPSRPSLCHAAARGFRPEAGGRRISALAEMRDAVTRIRLSDALIDYIVDVDPGDPRARLARGRRLDPRRQHAGRRGARFRGAAGTRLRHPRRRQDAGAARLRHRVMLSPGAEIEGLSVRSHSARDPRPDAGAPMIRPTRRAVMIFTLGVPLALFLVIYDAGLWALSFDYGVLVLVAVATDGLLAFPPRRLKLDVAVPQSLYIGERGVVGVTIARSRYRRRGALRASRRSRRRARSGGARHGGARAGRRGAHQPAHRPPPPRPRHDRAALGALARAARPHAARPRPPGRSHHRRAAECARRQERGASSSSRMRRFSASRCSSSAARARSSKRCASTRRVDNSRHIDWKHSARHRKLLSKEFQTERNHQVILAFDTGYLMREPIDGIPRLDHVINAALLLAWISLHGGDLVGTFAFDAALRHYLTPVRGINNFARIQQAAAELEYRTDETNFTLGLAELGARLKRRALVILFTEFVDTVTAELLVESMQRVAARHVVVFVTLRDSLMQRVVDAPPSRFERVAEAVIAHDLLRERSIVFERLERLGVHCLDVPSRGLSVALINRYLMVKQRGLI